MKLIQIFEAMSRRDFLKRAGAAVVAAGFPVSGIEARPKSLPKHPAADWVEKNLIRILDWSPDNAGDGDYLQHHVDPSEVEHVIYSLAKFFKGGPDEWNGSDGSVGWAFRHGDVPALNSAIEDVWVDVVVNDDGQIDIGYQWNPEDAD